METFVVSLHNKCVRVVNISVPFMKHADFFKYVQMTI